MDSTWIRQRLYALDMTQKALAAKLGMTASALSRKLNHQRGFTLREAAGLAQWLQMSDAEVRQHIFSPESCMKQRYDRRRHGTV